MSVIPSKKLLDLSERSRACVERLRECNLQRPDLSNQPRSRLASVLVLIYEKAGHLRVLLTTRSKALRTHAGQTALPGGKVDDIDASLVETAYREAKEEVALPLDSPDIHTLCILEPFLSAHGLLVTPVVALLTDVTILDTLKASEEEVSCIFNHPLEALLDPSLVEDLGEPIVSPGSEDWPYEPGLHNTTDVTVSSLGNITYRMHRFRSIASPVKGLTSDILIKTAEIAYSRAPNFEHYAPGQPHGFEAIIRIVEEYGSSQAKPDVNTVP